MRLIKLKKGKKKELNRENMVDSEYVLFDTKPETISGLTHKQVSCRDESSIVRISIGLGVFLLAYSRSLPIVHLLKTLFNVAV